ncbi:MAG TPA: hypothetical protein V6D23_26230 [Candidatus Obscuribacterales bacterium]
MKRLISLFVLLALALPAVALTPNDFKAFMGPLDAYSSHARYKQIALLMISDEGAQIPYIANLSTQKKFPIFWSQLTYIGKQQMLFELTGPDCSATDLYCANAGGISYRSLNALSLEFRLVSGQCQSFSAVWNPRKQGYDAKNHGIAPCRLKHYD